MGCRMARCDGPPERGGFCAEHLRQMVQDPLWVPVKSVPRPDSEPDVFMTVCGLCRTEVWVLHRMDEPQQRPYILETTSAVDGRCEIINGGFRVLTARGSTIAGDLKVPLYQTHGPRCVARRTLMEVTEA